MANAVQTKQAIGRAALRNLEQRIPDHMTLVMGTFEKLLNPLLVTPPSTKTIQKLQKIVRESIALSKEITEESALYHWAWIPGGTLTEEVGQFVDHINAPGNGDLVLWCTFPAFCRRFKQDGKEGNVCVVKAIVELTGLLNTVVAA
jgi:hypothetical protein